MIMRSEFYLFMRSKLTIKFHNFDQEDNTLIMRSKLKKALLATFDLTIVLVTNKLIIRSKLKKASIANFDCMNNFLVTSAIMRSKVFMHRWLIIRAKISHRCNLINLNSFNLKIALAANKLFMRSKLKKALLTNFDLMFELVTNKSIMRSKLKKALLANFDHMKNAAIRRSNNY